MRHALTPPLAAMGLCALFSGGVQAQNLGGGFLELVMTGRNPSARVVQPQPQYAPQPEPYAQRPNFGESQAYVRYRPAPMPDESAARGYGGPEYVPQHQPARATRVAIAPPMEAVSPVRQAIMDAMRVMAGDDRVYVVRYLKVSGDWVWLDADPRSRNGRNRYEPESALLRRTGGVWRVVDAPCVEETCDPRPKEITRIRRANPSAPAAIFPR